MSIGIYIASYHKINVPFSREPSEILSVNDLRKLENYTDIVADLKKNLVIDVSDLDPNEKLFMFLDESAESFSIKRDKDSGTINSYTDKPFIYYVDVYSWENFYEPFTDFLRTINAPLELWRIWEDEYEIDDLKTVKLDSLDAVTLKKEFGMYDYFGPIVGIYE